MKLNLEYFMGGGGSHMILLHYYSLLSRIHIGAVLVEPALVLAHPDVLPHAGPGVGAHN